MRIINNTSSVSAEFLGIPSNFVSNNVQTIVNDPIVPQCDCNICIFFDFCSGCYFNPCDNVREMPCNSFPEPINNCENRFDRNRGNCNGHCNKCCNKRKWFLRCKCKCKRVKNNCCSRQNFDW